jgi:hypothetical protein
MTEKPKLGPVSKWWKQVTGGDASDTRARYCDKGHPMDPNWTTCAYCEAQSRVNEKTLRSSTAQPENSGSNDQTERSESMGPRHTQIDPGISEEESGHTKIDTQSEPIRKKTNVQDRKITGVLVTFSWKFQGELFALYEGRNVIGSAGSSDIQITTDPSMSGDHAVILCRAGRDELHDLLSTNGTFLNEKYVERDGADLTDLAAIRTGRTVFEFRKITSGGTAGRDELPQYKSPHAQDDRRGKGETSI